MLDAILFDLDGTLLPMDNDVFTKGYLSLLSRAIAPHGYEPREMISAMWYGVEAMVLRSAVPEGIRISPISMEELFVFMIKETK